jgi:hypothetical protein
VALALIFPSLTLIPLGGLYLWDKGWLLWWAVGAAVLIISIYAAFRWLLPDVATPPSSEISPEEGPSAGANPLWTAAEEKAWADVRSFARRVDVDELFNFQALVGLGRQTVELVARRLHPEKADAIWNFTVPELLAIFERVSRRLSGFVQEAIPFGDRLTVSQVLYLYRWRSVTEVAEKAYDIWRLVRLVNPATAITHEARERLSRAMMQWGREHVTRRLAETYIEEVGRAAIDLYGGRLKITNAHIESDLNDFKKGDEQSALSMLSLRVMISGGAADKRAALASLIDTIRQRRIAALAALLKGDDGQAEAVNTVDVQIVVTADDAPSAVALDAVNADAVLWLLTRDEYGTLDRSFMSALADYFNAHTELMPPVVIPIALASGPETDNKPLFTKERDLEGTSAIYGGPILDIVTLSLADSDEERDRKRLLAAFMLAAPHARRVSVARSLNRIKQRSDWKGAGRQAISAAGTLAGAVWSGLRRNRHR